MATAPARSRLTARELPRGRRRVTRSCQEATEVVAYQVSTLTRPRSSGWPEYVVRGSCLFRRDQSATVSHVPVVPSAARPRTSTRTRLLPGVVASQEGMSAVAPKGWVAHGEVQVPASYARPATVRVRGSSSETLPRPSFRPLRVPDLSSA